AVHALPEGYVSVRRGRVDAFVWRSALPWLEGVLGDARDSSLETWARGRARTDAGTEGRGAIFVFAAPAPGPDGRARWALRHYRRGGLVAPLLGDRYLAA